METTDLSSPAYWEDETPDLRGNPVGSGIQQGLVEFVAAEPRLRGHVLMATSGSEGEPKWIALSKRALRASAESVNAHLETTPEDRWLCALPTFHVGGFGVHARAFVGRSPVMTFEGRWRDRASEFVSCCERNRISLTTLTPTQVHDLVVGGFPAPASMRVVVVGGGRLDPEIGAAARELGWPVLASFGMTETASQVATETLSALGEPFSGEWLPVLPAWEASTGEGGCLRLRGKALFSGTVRRTTRGVWFFEPLSRDEDGWFVTRDRVEIRQERNGRSALRFLGRLDDRVKKLGELVSIDALRERLDGILGQHRNRVAFLALPDERMEHRFVVVVETSEESSVEIEEAVKRFNREALPFERIDEVCRIERLPRSALGKVVWGELRQRLSG